VNVCDGGDDADWLIRTTTSTSGKYWKRERLYLRSYHHHCRRRRTQLQLHLTVVAAAAAVVLLLSVAAAAVPAAVAGKGTVMLQPQLQLG